LEKIHNLKKRVPLILSPDDEMKWIDPGLKTDQIKELIKPFPQEKMKAYTISRDANNARIHRDYPEILKPVQYPELVEEENLLF
jgi:putative SOS response-associated peptidase YedK